MEDQLITYPTAVLAKEKGFCRPVLNYFKLGVISHGVQEENITVYKNINGDFKNNPLFSRPTQSLLKKWLRIEHKINVNVKHIPHNQRYSYNITGSYHDGVNGVLKSYDFKSFETEEECLDVALQEALKLIK